MTIDHDHEQDLERELDLQRELRAGRKFSLADVIAQEGGGFLKGESPIPKLLQVKAEINIYIDRHLPDSSGALQAVLQDRVKGDELHISRNLDQPLKALQDIVQVIVNNQQQLYEFVRQVDVRWGQIYGERPYFQQPGHPAHPEDEYTHDSVRESLTRLLHQISQDL
jgi:hypothetical protein